MGQTNPKKNELFHLMSKKIHFMLLFESFFIYAYFLIKGGSGDVGSSFSYFFKAHQQQLSQETIEVYKKLWQCFSCGCCGFVVVAAAGLLAHHLVLCTIIQIIYKNAVSHQYFPKGPAKGSLGVKKAPQTAAAVEFCDLFWALLWCQDSCTIARRLVLLQRWEENSI